MNPLRAHLLALAVCSATVGPAVAQNLPADLGLPGLYSLSGSLSLRGDYAPGLNWSRATSVEALGEGNGTGLRANRASLYADWFPFNGSLRLVGGVNLNDSRQDITTLAYGLGGSAPAGTGGMYNLRQKYPGTSTYLGIGYGQLALPGKGLGFYADMGVALSTLPADADSSQGGSAGPAVGMDGWRTQTNGWLGFRYLPSVSLGLIYRY